MPIGSLSHVGIAKETTFGTAVAATDYVRFASETIAETIEQVKSDINMAIVDDSPYQEGLHTVAGDVKGDVYPNIIGHFLRSALGAPVSTQPNSGTAPTVYQHVFTPSQTNFATTNALPSYTLEVNRDLGAANAFQYVGAVVNELTMDFGVDTKIMNFTAAILAKALQGLITKTTPSFDAQDPFVWSQVSVQLNSATNANISTFEIGVKNALDARPTLDGTKTVNRILRNGKREFPVKFTVELQDTTEYQLWKNQSEVPLTITLTGANIASTYNYSIKFEFPKFHFNAFPINVSGAGVITAAMDGWGEYDPTSTYGMRVTLVNTKSSY